MDSEFLQAFIEEAESYLPTIRGGILIYLQEGKIFGELEQSMRQLHTIKGAAAMIGLGDIGNLAAGLQDLVTDTISNKIPLTPDLPPKMLDMLAQIEEFLLKARLAEENANFDLGSFIDESFDNIQINNQNGMPAKELRQEDFGVELEEKTEIIADDDFEIDDEMLEIFALEAEELLRNIGANLETLKTQPDNLEALMEVRRNAHTFKGSAGIVGLKESSRLAHRVEDLLDYLAEYDIPGDHKILHLLIASTDCLSAMTAGEKSENLTAKVKQIYLEFDQINAALEGQEETAETVETIKAPASEVSEIILELPVSGEIESEEIAESQILKPTAFTNPKSIVRVSLEKLDDLVKVVRGLVSTRSVFEQRLGELDRQIDELTNSTRRLQRSTTKLETDFEADMMNAQSPVSRVQNQWSSPVNAPVRNPQAFDSLEFDRYTEFHQTTRELVETTNDALSINSALDGLRGNLESLFDNQRRLIEEMQDKLLRIRMVNFGSLSARLHRTLRVTCDEEGKQAELVIAGENMEVDTQILDSLIEPLLHLLRNSVAHGIEMPDTRRLLGKPEKGKISLRAHSEGTHIILSISDDGRGISASALKEKALQNNLLTPPEAVVMSEEEAFELIFLPGITTAEKLSQTAGRGVGMNIVRTTVERRQGTISIASEPQKGTTFTIRLPMALAVTRALLVKVGERDFAFPLNNIRQISETTPEMLEKAVREKFIQLGAVKYTVANLNELLGFPAPAAANEDETALLLLEMPENPYALLVDRIIKPEEIVIKPLGFPLHNFAETLGAATLGDGSVVPVLDLFYLLNRRNRARKPQPVAETAPPKREITVMIVDDSPSVRHLNSNLVKKAGFKPLIAKDGLEALELLQTVKVLPDVILTDVEMPRMDGYELLSSLKRQENLHVIPVIMITSRAGEKHRRKAFDLGVSEYVSKPFDDVKLVEMIKFLAEFKGQSYK